MSHDRLCPVAFMQRQNQDGGNCFCPLIDAVRADEQAKSLAAIQRIRDMHKPFQTSGVLGSVTHCSHCTRLIGENPKIYMAFWPCDTIRALEGESDARI